MAGDTYGSNVVILSIISCVLSIIGGLVILITFIILPEIQNFTRKLIAWLTVADIMSAMGYLVSTTNYLGKRSDPDTDRTVCRIQSTITTFSSIASFFWTSIIAIFLYDTITHRNCRLGTRCWHICFVALGWGLPGM